MAQGFLLPLFERACNICRLLLAWRKERFLSLSGSRHDRRDEDVKEKKEDVQVCECMCAGLGLWARAGMNCFQNCSHWHWRCGGSGSGRQPLIDSFAATAQGAARRDGS
jgi:hypothetical protein